MIWKQHFSPHEGNTLLVDDDMICQIALLKYNDQDEGQPSHSNDMLFFSSNHTGSGNILI